MGRAWPWSKAALFVVCAVLGSRKHVAGSELAGYCLPEDFQRSYSDCVDGFREVSFYLDRSIVRDCIDPFVAPPSRKEPCTCTPGEYTRFAGLNGTTCSVAFLAAGCQMPNNNTVPVLQYNGTNDTCPLASQWCTDANLHSVRTKCEGIGGNFHAEEKFVQVIYFFDGQCDPYHRDSIKLPPRTKLSCDHTCPAGTFLKHHTCEACPAGTFSLGGGIQFPFFDPKENPIPGLLQTKCEFKNVSGTQNCTGWQVKSGVLQVGPFDPPNTMNFVECDEFASFPCHNALLAYLSMTVEIVRDGYVKFAYTVSSEIRYDGLRFFIDSLSKPVLGIESSQMHPKTVNFSLEAGVHTLTWLYSKDSQGSSGKDMATISFLEVNGTSFSDEKCSPCAPGFFSSGGEAQCTPCPVNSFSGSGAASCDACSPETYSLLAPRTQCSPRKPCDYTKDASPSYSACKASTHTMWQEWHWIEPQTCLPGEGVSALPPTQEVPCPPCPPGMHSVHIPTDDIATCQFCPPGTYRNSTQTFECTPCGEGEAAVPFLSLHQLLSLRDPRANDTLPPGFQSGCSGECGPSAWRVGNGGLDSGAGHGPSVVVWLSLTVNLDREGYVYTNLSVDIPQGDTQRGLFFHIDDYPTEQIIDDEYDDDEVGALNEGPLNSGPWPLSKGTHRLMWTWMKVHSSSDNVERDSAVLYDVKVVGSSEGGADGCERVPEGAVLNENKSGFDTCPPGTFSVGGSGNCTECPANTFNPKPMGGPRSCEECGLATTSLPGSDECILGDAQVPSSFCTYKIIPRRGVMGAFEPLSFDLSPLYQAHPGQVFGPVYSDPTSPTKDDEPMFFVSICERDKTNTSCYDYDGNPLNTYACRTNVHSFLEGDLRPGRSVGERVSVSALALDDWRLERRGLKMVFESESCPGGGNASLTLTLICDPNAGVGMPEAWTEGGYAAATNPELAFPHWLNRSGAILPVEGPEGVCRYSMVWYTAHACPVCWPTDLEFLVLPDCPNNTLIKYKFKEPRTCQPSPLSGSTGRDIPCRPCRESDYVKTVEACADAEGNHNVTYRWTSPKMCSERLNGSVNLPVNIAAGVCAQEVKLVPSKTWSAKSIVSIVLIVLCVVAFAVISVRNWLKTRKMYREYTQLRQTKAGMVEEIELEENSANGQSAA